MIIPLQVFDPGNLGPYTTTAAVVAVYLMLEKRLRRVEERLNRLAGFVEGEQK